MTIESSYDTSLAQIREKLLPDERIRAVVHALAQEKHESAEALMTQVQKYQLTGIDPRVFHRYVSWMVLTWQYALRRAEGYIVLVSTAQFKDDHLLDRIVGQRASHRRAWCEFCADHGMQAAEVEHAFGVTGQLDLSVCEDGEVQADDVEAERARLEQGLAGVGETDAAFRGALLAHGRRGNRRA